MENNNRQGCRWVKCSDRLPDKEGVYTVKRHFSEQPEKAEYTGSIFTNYQGYVVKEWLDESIEPCATSSENYWKQRCEAAEDYIRWIFTSDVYGEEERARIKWEQLKKNEI